MPQLHLYVPESVAAEIGRRARARGLSVSRYLAELVRSEMIADWPEGYFDEVVGGWQGEPLERPADLPFEERPDLS